MTRCSPCTSASRRDGGSTEQASIHDEEAPDGLVEVPVCTDATCRLTTVEYRWAGRGIAPDSVSTVPSTVAPARLSLSFEPWARALYAIDPRAARLAAPAASGQRGNGAVRVPRADGALVSRSWLLAVGRHEGCVLDAAARQVCSLPCSRSMRVFPRFACGIVCASLIVAPVCVDDLRRAAGARAARVDALLATVLELDKPYKAVTAKVPSARTPSPWSRPCGRG